MTAYRLWEPTDTNRIAYRDFTLMRGGPAGAQLNEHAHPELQITLRFGPVKKPSPGRRRTAQVSLWAPHESHSGGWPSGWDVLVVHLGPQLLAEAVEELRPGGRFELLPLQGERDGLLEEVGQAILRDFCGHQRRTSFYLDSLAAFLAGRIVRSHGVAHSPLLPLDHLSGTQLARLHHFIQRKAEAGFSVADLARASGLPTHRFAARLRMTTGMSPWAFVQSYRISLARSMLRNRRMTIADVGHALGFSSQSHFTKAFRKTAGCTPNAYRKSL